jgi:hypothetical protein
MKVLIAEDEKDTAVLYKDTVEEKNNEVITRTMMNIVLKFIRRNSKT